MASQQITEEEVYLCTGNPLPRDIEQISYWLLNESFAESYRSTNLITFFLISYFCYQVQSPTLHISVVYISFYVLYSL